MNDVRLDKVNDNNTLIYRYFRSIVPKTQFQLKIEIVDCTLRDNVKEFCIKHLVLTILLYGLIYILFQLILYKN